MVKHNNASAAWIAGTGCGECLIPSINLNVANTEIYGENDNALVSSETMKAAYSGQCIKIPFNILSNIFYNSNKWCLWNGLFGPVTNEYLIEQQPLYAQFNALPNVTLPNDTQLKPPIIKLVNNNKNNDNMLQYGWIFSFSSNVDPDDVYIYGRHNYILNAMENEAKHQETCVVNWEKANGKLLENSQINAKNMEYTLHCNGPTLDAGLKCLEYIYHNIDSSLSFDIIEEYCHKYTGFGCNKSAQESQTCVVNTFTPHDITKHEMIENKTEL